MNQCEVCGTEIEGRAKTCSVKCRKALSRDRSVTGDGSVTLETKKSVTFEFRTPNLRSDSGWHEDDKGKPIVRKALTWFEVPIAAQPVLQKDWPKMPEGMNGRQYFLWWRNEFKIEEDGRPVIINPFPERTNLRYEMGGEGSRKWGA